jgi:hypothetical protein
MTRYFIAFDRIGAVHMSRQPLNKAVQIRVRVNRLDSKRILVEFHLLRRQSVPHDDRTTAFGPDLDDRSNPHADLAAHKAGPRKKGRAT